MKIDHKVLPKSRHQYAVELTAVEVAEYFEQALKTLAAKIKIGGFRAGKAPLSMVRSAVSESELREEAYSYAVQNVWKQIINSLKVTPIHDPEVSLDTFEEGKPAKIMVEFDIRPEVKLGKWQDITIHPDAKSQVTDADVEEVLTSLLRANAQTIITLERAKKGDRIEVTFEGTINNIKNDKLSSKHFPVVIGQSNAIPGFEDQLIGLKKGETKKFSLVFPKDHFDKEIAGKKVEFSVNVDEVFNIILPPIDQALAKKFGHDTLDQLKKAIKDDLIQQKADEVFTQQKAKWLADFEKKVTVDLPESLIVAEVERSKAAWQDFLVERNLGQEDWLKTRGVTLEKMMTDWRQAATSSVTIGLGLAEIAKEQKKELKDNTEFQKLLDELVRQALKK